MHVHMYIPYRALDDPIAKPSEKTLNSPSDPLSRFIRAGLAKATRHLWSEPSDPILTQGLGFKVHFWVVDSSNGPKYPKKEYISMLGFQILILCK